MKHGYKKRNRSGSEETLAYLRRWILQYKQSLVRNFPHLTRAHHEHHDKIIYPFLANPSSLGEPYTHSRTNIDRSMSRIVSSCTSTMTNYGTYVYLTLGKGKAIFISDKNILHENRCVRNISICVS